MLSSGASKLDPDAPFFGKWGQDFPENKEPNLTLKT